MIILKTIKEIADSIGVDKQKVYRFIRKNHITASGEVKQSLLYDDAAQRLIKSAFNHITTSKKRCGEALQKTPEQLMLETLVKELQTKNEQLATKDLQIAEQQQSISELTAALQNTTESLKGSQALHAGTMYKQIPSTTKKPSKRPLGLFMRIFRK